MLTCLVFSSPPWTFDAVNPAISCVRVSVELTVHGDNIAVLFLSVCACAIYLVLAGVVYVINLVDVVDAAMCTVIVEVPTSLWLMQVDPFHFRVLWPFTTGWLLSPSRPPTHSRHLFSLCLELFTPSVTTFKLGFFNSQSCSWRSWFFILREHFCIVGCSVSPAESFSHVVAIPCRPNRFVLVLVPILLLQKLMLCRANLNTKEDQARNSKCLQCANID